MTEFSFADWMVVVGYLVILAMFGWFFSRKGASSARDYFLGGNEMSLWLVTISVLATTQSAATFLGGPDYGYRGDYTYLSTFIGAFLAAVFVAKILVPRFYAIRATTVYELLAVKFGDRATKAAGAMYLIGRVFANGARLYMAAIAVSMILFADVAATSVITASFAIVLLGFVFTFVGGIRSVIWSDFVQFLIYAGAAIGVLIYLRMQIPLPFVDILDALANTPSGQNKLTLIDFSFSFSQPFSIWAVGTGVFLLYVGNFGLDQDTTQRLLSCKDEKGGGKAIIFSVLIAIPLVWVFVSIGELLHIFYERPDLMARADTMNVASEFQGETITVFMFYILSEIPSGLRGLVTVGVLAAAISTLNSGLNSMSSVLIEDFYRPWIERRRKLPPGHFVNAGRIGMAVFALSLFLMSAVCFYWQRYAQMPLLEFALSVMTFAYAGLLGVFFVAVFTNRGSANSVIAALIIGFFVILAQQAFMIDILGLPEAMKNIAFPWKLCVGVIVAAVVCSIGKTNVRKISGNK